MLGLRWPSAGVWLGLSQLLLLQLLHQQSSSALVSNKTAWRPNRFGRMMRVHLLHRRRT